LSRIPPESGNRLIVRSPSASGPGILSEVGIKQSHVILRVVTLSVSYLVREVVITEVTVSEVWQIGVVDVRGVRVKTVNSIYPNKR